MYCGNCGAELTAQSNFCPYCGAALQIVTPSVSLLNKAVSAAKDTNQYSLVLVSQGTCDAVMAGDLLEDVFGYTDAESANLVKMAPVVVGENLTAEEAATVAQMYTEYGMDVSVTDRQDQYVDLTGKANSSIFDSSGSLLAGAAAIIGALTVANRISSYRRFKKPSLLERLFRINYKPAPPKYHRSFRPRLDPMLVEPRRTIRKPVPPRAPAPQRGPVLQRSPAPQRGRAPQQRSAPTQRSTPQNRGPAGGGRSGGSSGSRGGSFGGKGFGPSGGHGGNRGR